MANNSMAHLYEDETIEAARFAVGHMFNHLPAIRPDFHILDLACGTGSVTKIIYEHCQSEGIAPPKITGLDIGDNFIKVFHENKKALNWDTADAFIGDASDLKMFKVDTFDIVIMNFALFAVPDAAANTVAAEIYRVLKPRGLTAITTWRESFVERIMVGTNKAIGRPEEYYNKLKIGKWLKVETARETLLAGGFEPGKVQHFQLDYGWTFDDKEGILDRFSSVFWKGICARDWSEEEKTKWRSILESCLTDEERKTAKVPLNMWLLIGEK